jgi:hypothetical protein
MISSGLEVDWAREGIDTSRSVKTNSGRMGAFYCVGIFAAAKIAHLSDDETVAKMGHPDLW